MATDDKIRLGSVVEWTSSSNGSTKTKHGFIADIVPPGSKPNANKFPRLSAKSGGVRHHVSYVVKSGGKVYWPVVNRLKLVHVASTKSDGAWVMPEWMKPYVEFICNTGGNSVEELMNADSKTANVVVNAPLALICVAVKSQVWLLEELHKKGLLK